MPSSYELYGKTLRKNIEFNYEAEWDKYCDDTATLKRFIRFGETDANILDTGIDIDVIPYNGLAYTDGKKSVGLVCGSNFVSSNIFPFRTDTFHRSGAAHASAFRGAIPTGRVSPRLVKCVHEGTIDKIIVCLTSFLSQPTSNGPSKATVVQVQEFSYCYMTFVDMTTYPYLTIFDFAFQKNRILITDYDSKASHTPLGNFAYEFDYGNNIGKYDKV